MEKSESKNFNLKTDKNGSINLGSLKKIMGLSASVPTCNIEKNFMLSH